MAESQENERERAFIPLTQRDLERNRDLFVRPSGIPEESDDDRKRLFLIVGEKESGKEIAAINFALSIVEREKLRSGEDANAGAGETLPVKMYQHRGGPMFFDINENLTNPVGPGIFIIPDIDTYNWHPDALSERSVDFYTKKLGKHRTYFIFTAQTGAASKIGIPPYRTDGMSPEDLEAVLEKHEIHYLKSNQIKDQPILTALHDPKIMQDMKNRNRLGTPKRIGILFQNLVTASPREGEEAETLQRIIRNIAISETPARRRWFRELPMNVKLFAMTMAILQNNDYRLTRFAAEELYFAFVQKVRQKPGMDNEAVFVDPRRVGFDDVISNANMFMQGSTLTFNSDQVLSSILDDEIANYQGLLWILAEMLVDQIEPPPPQSVRNPAVYNYIGNPDAPTLVFGNAQEVLANLVGTVGSFRKERLRDLLERLSEKDVNKKLAGQILRPLAKNSQHHDFLLSILDSWLYPKNANGGGAEPYHPEVVITALWTLATNYAAAARAKDVTPSTRRKLRDMVAHTAEIGGAFDAFVTAHEKLLNKQLQREIDETRETKGEKALTEGDIKAKRDDLAVAVAQYSLFYTEYFTISLLLMLREIAEEFPEDVVDIINEWLKNGLKQVENDEFDLEDDADIERMLRIEDASALRDAQTRAARKRQERRRRVVLHNMQWHVAMLSAVMFFEADVLTEKEEPEAEARATETDEAQPDPVLNAGVSEDDEADGAVRDESPDDHAGETPAAAEPTTPENDETAAVSEGGAEPDAAAGEVPVSLNEQSESPGGAGAAAAHHDEPPPGKGAEALPDPKPATSKEKKVSDLQPRKKSDNRIGIVQKKFPFLELVPNLLASVDINFTPTSFLENMTRGAEVRQYFRTRKVDYMFDVPFDFLQRDPLRAAFRMMHKWYGIMVDDLKNPDEEGRAAWMGTVFPVLLKLFNHATQGQRPRLREILFTEGWVESRYPEIRTIAHALLARSFILDGRVLDLPANRYGVVLLDWGIRDYQWDRYYQSAYHLVQQLAAITPLRIYALGAKKLVKEIAGREGDVQILPRELRPRHRTSPRLLMPFFENVKQEQEAILHDVRNTHFILALTPLENLFYDPQDPAIKPDIPDLLDVVEWVIEGTPDIDPQLQKILTSNLYREEEKEKARQALAAASQQATEWAWKQKLFLLTPDKERIVAELNTVVGDNNLPGTGRSGGIEALFSLVDVQDDTFHEDVDTIVTKLSVKLGQNLHQLDDAEWERNLRDVWETNPDDSGLDYTFSFDDLPTIQKHLNEWINSLEDVTKARHPRDITMTIIWTVLALSKRDLPYTVAMVQGWLEAGEPQANIMGLAGAKTLYNFYYLSPDIHERREDYLVLLDLLPAVMELEQGRDSSEFSQFLNIVMMLARDAAWSQLFMSDTKRPLADAVKKIKDRRGLADLRHLVSSHQIFALLARLYVASGLNWPGFREFMYEVAGWYSKTSPNRRAQHISQLEDQFQTAAIPKNLVQRAVSLLDEIGTGIGSMYTTPSGIWVFTAFATGQVSELARSSEAELNEIVLRMRNISNFIMLHAMRRPDNRMPALSDGQQYGVILIRAADRQRAKDLRSHVIGFVKDLRLRLKDGEYHQVVFTIHHLGRADLIYNDRPTPPTQADLRLPDKMPEPALLLTPILESYRLEDVAFVLIVSDLPPLDLADWRGEDAWADKIYLFGRGRSFWIDSFYEAGDEHHKQRIKADIKEVTDMIMEVIKG